MRAPAGFLTLHLDPERAGESPTAIETERSVVIHEDMTEAVISEEGAEQSLKM